VNVKKADIGPVLLKPCNRLTTVASLRDDLQQWGIESYKSRRAVMYDFAEVEFANT